MPEQKKPHSKSATKEKSDLSHSTVKQNEHKPQGIINAVITAYETKSQRSEISHSAALNLNVAKNESQPPANENPNEEKSAAISSQQNSAHFQLPPDTEDL